MRAFIQAVRFAHARGVALDMLGQVVGVTRMPARLWRWNLPWGQRDATYRRRILAALLCAPGRELA